MRQARALAPSSGTADEKRLFRAMVLTGAFMIAEAAGGLYAGSLALIADAGHMLADCAALGLAWMAFRIARRPRDGRRSYGYHRVQVLAALANGALLIAIVGWILFEAVRRLFAPVEVLGGAMLVIAIAGLAVNALVLASLRHGDHENLNIQGALLHVIGDVLGSVAAIVAAVVIVWTGWTPVDPLLSALVALLILRSAWALLARAVHVLLEGTPERLDLGRLGADLTGAVPTVADVHHVHAWSLTHERPLITLHATVPETSEHARPLAQIKAFLSETYGISHSTIQIETERCADD
jgi:cobalt-zinc-cadmium efflux system protein